MRKRPCHDDVYEALDDSTASAALQPESDEQIQYWIELVCNAI
ncbi:MAG: hypothetical protein WBP64_03110 [Nitrososphaeraceae archaeon]